MKLTSNAIAWRTDTGRRPGNEDCCGYHLADNRTAGVLVVADGMGGHASGEVASQMAVSAVLGAFQQHGFDDAETLLSHAILAAHRHIAQEAAQHEGKRGMGTTIVAAVLREGEVIVGHIGDSRALQFRLPHVRRLTRDHLFAIDVLGVPENLAKHHENGNVLSQALGSEGEITPSLNRFDIASGDVLVLCTDGISECVDEMKMAQILQQHKPARAAEELIKCALERGSLDNCTALCALA